MPLLDRQKRTAEIGIIRLGTSRSRQDGRGREPVKLDRFRFTSRSQAAIEAIAGQYGGTAQEWADGAPTPGQWEVITLAREIPVAVPPGGFVLDAWYELWVKGVRERKCDGRAEQLADRPCLCDPANRQCKPHSRLRVILPDIPGGGVWRVNSSGENAADELAGVAETMEQYAARGSVLPAVLRLEQRVTLTKKGTNRYVVPVLQLTQSIRELTAVQAGSMELPPAPVNLRAIAAAPAAAAGASPVPVVAVAEPVTPAEGLPVWPPKTPQELAAWVEKSPDQGALDRMARDARGSGWIDEFVDSRFAPVEGEAIELLEVFRGRQAEITGGESR